MHIGTYVEDSNRIELDGDLMDRESLMAAAREAALNAYAPYSHFRVGAALLLSVDGKSSILVTGANVENASLGLTICAERVALARACMIYGESSTSRQPPDMKPLITRVAIACIDVPTDATPELRSPCGACRQWLAELASSAVFTLDGVSEEFLLDDLLPHAFRMSS
jgi:cytidine deaminase